MFRKTHFKDEERSVFQEIKKEFSGTFSRGEDRAVNFLNSYPKLIFISMVVVIIVSSIISFLFNPFESAPEQPKSFFYEDVRGIKNEVSGEVSTLLSLTDRISRMSLLRSEIERIIQQEQITAEDSVFLENAIQELEYFNNQNKLIYED